MQKTPSIASKLVSLYLRVAWWGAIVACLVLVLMIPAIPSRLVDPDQPKLAVRLHVRFSLPETVTVGAPGTVVPEPTVRGEGDVWLPTTSLGPWVLFFALAGLAGAVVLYILWQLRRVSRAVQEGNPFDPENARRVRRIGLVVLAWSLVLPVVSYFGTEAVLDKLSGNGLVLQPPLIFNPDALFLGLAILVLAELFRRAGEIQQEHSLTI